MDTYANIIVSLIAANLRNNNVTTMRDLHFYDVSLGTVSVTRYAVNYNIKSGWVGVYAYEWMGFLGDVRVYESWMIEIPDYEVARR